MEVDADLHLHGLHSGGVSDRMEIPVIAEQAGIKGLDLVGTGDILNPSWREHVKDSTEELGSGIREADNGSRFLLTTEVEDRDRVHHLLLFPSFGAAEDLYEEFKRFSSDIDQEGRPRLDLTGEEIAQACERNDVLVGPCHAFTPWTALYSKFDSLQGCYGNSTDYLSFLELGLSADTSLADSISEHHDMTFVSFSDAHCVHPETVIYQSDGSTKTIEEMAEGNDVKTMNWDSAQTESGEAVKLHSKEAPDTMVTVESPSGTLKTTPTHRFFVFEEGDIREKHATELQEGDLIASIDELGAESEDVPLDADIDVYHDVTEEGRTYLENKRLEAGEYQKDLASSLSVSPDHYSALMQGRHKIKEQFLKDLSDQLGFDIEEFIAEYSEEIYPDITFPENVDNELAQLLGYLLGDGGREVGKKTRGFSFTDKDEQLAEHYHGLICNVFGDVGWRKEDSNHSSVRRIYPSFLLDIIESLCPDIFAPSPDRRVPDAVYRLEQGDISSFLRGFFDAEGSVGHHHVDAASSSLTLLREIQVLLLHIGVRSCIDADRLEPEKEKYRHRLYIYGQHHLSQFQEDIGFDSQKKQGKLESLLSSYKQQPKSSNNSFVPVQKAFRKAVMESGVTHEELGHLSNHVDREDYRFSKLNLQQLMERFRDRLESTSTFETLEKYHNGNLVFEPVKRVEEKEPNCDYVYDLTVPETQNYVANSLVVHNSPWPHRLGREFTRFEVEELSFRELEKAFERKGGRGTTLNVGFDPREGKYHCTACNDCYQKYDLEQAEKFDWTCQECGRTIKKGVKDRIKELADTQVEDSPEFRPEYVHLFPLAEIIQEVVGHSSPTTKTVQKIYDRFQERFSSEIEILTEKDIEELEKVNREVADAVEKFRGDEIVIVPGGGGSYGELVIPSDSEEKERIEERREDDLECSYTDEQSTLESF